MIQGGRKWLENEKKIKGNEKENNANEETLKEYEKKMKGNVRKIKLNDTKIKEHKHNIKEIENIKFGHIQKIVIVKSIRLKLCNFPKNGTPLKMVRFWPILAVFPMILEIRLVAKKRRPRRPKNVQNFFLHAHTCGVVVQGSLSYSRRD